MLFHWTLEIMWRFLFRPDVLFGFALMQGLLPYVLWSTGIVPASESSNFTYLPIVIWILGYGSFLLGTFLFGSKTPGTQGGLRVSTKKTSTFVWSLAILIVLQLIAVTAVYGTLPLLSYLRNDGQVNINDVNNMQESSGLGQIGLLAACNVVFNAALLLRLVCHLNQKKRLTFGTVALILVSALSSLYAGKRQGLLITAVYLMCGLTLVTGSPVQALSRLVKLPRLAKSFTWPILILAIAGFFALIGFMSTARNQGVRGRTGIEETLAYLEYPVLNLERQTQDSGLGPYEFDLLYPALPLIPYKLQTFLADRLIPPPVKPITTSPSSFFERLQWGWGPLGTSFFCFVTGGITMRLYRRSNSNIVALLVYCQCAYALLTAYAYNHFLNLVFLPLPTLVFLVVGKRLLDNKDHQPLLKLANANQPLPASAGAASSRHQR